MVDQPQRSGLVTDFAAKRTTYYESNYATATSRNALRRERRELFNRLLSEATNLSLIMDAGCGPALLYDEAYARCDEYHAFDIVQSNLDELSKDNAKVKCQCVDLDAFRPSDQKFDVIICSGSLEYAQAGLDAVANLCKTLSPGGLLIASFPSSTSPYRIWNERLFLPLLRLIKKSDADYRRTLFSERDVRRVMESSGLCVRQIHRLGYCVVPRPLDLWFPSIAYRLRTMIQRRCSDPLSFLATEFVVVAEQAPGRVS